MPVKEFRFDALNHKYIELQSGVVLPHITGMLEAAGWIDDTWFTEESSERGTMVHRLTADYDLGAIEDPADVSSRYKGWLLAHVAALAIMRPTILAVEQPLVHTTLKFGGRPDRDVTLYAARSVLELKSGVPHKAHPIQTALQAILIGHQAGLPAVSIQRYCLYLRGDGKFKLEHHADRRDFTEAERIIRQCCRG